MSMECSCNLPEFELQGVINTNNKNKNSFKPFVIHFPVIAKLRWRSSIKQKNKMSPQSTRETNIVWNCMIWNLLLLKSRSSLGSYKIFLHPNWQMFTHEQLQVPLLNQGTLFQDPFSTLLKWLSPDQPIGFYNYGINTSQRPCFFFREKKPLGQGFVAS